MHKPFSIIIISYNRPHDLLALLKSITLLKGTNEHLQDVVIINNRSTINYTDVEDFIANQTLPFKYIVAPENLGVSRGRNYALQFAEGRYFIFLDDDTEIDTTEALLHLKDQFEQPSIDGRPVGVVSFKVLYYDNLQKQKTAFPHKNFSKYHHKSFFYTYYYPGCAHAIDKLVFDKTGALPQNFFYGMEEYDLSYRVINHGYCLTYTDSITVLHKESPLGRKPRNEVLRMMWVNKSIVAWKYLPKKYFYSTAILWSLFFLKNTKGSFWGFIKGWKQIFKIPGSQKRKPVTPEAFHYLEKVEARLWY